MSRVAFCLSLTFSAVYNIKLSVIRTNFYSSKHTLVLSQSLAKLIIIVGMVMPKDLNGEYHHVVYPISFLKPQSGSYCKSRYFLISRFILYCYCDIKQGGIRRHTLLSTCTLITNPPFIHCSVQTEGFDAMARSRLSLLDGYGMTDDEGTSRVFAGNRTQQRNHEDYDDKILWRSAR